MQRLRLSFGRGEEVKFISHLDIVRFWERALRRARVPLMYSQGFAPHPHIAIAAPLPVGVTSEAELMDVWLNRWMPPQSFLMGVRAQLLQGFEVFDAWQVAQSAPSLQSMVTFAEYRLVVSGEMEEQEVEGAIQSLLQSEELHWHYIREGKEKFYDLRALIENLWLIEGRRMVKETEAGEEARKFLENGREVILPASRYVLGMKLSCGMRGNGRPEQVASALGFSQRPDSIHRTGLMLEGTYSP
ncbi:MAG: DUF2344 domain-containing protein [Dehalococcoidia bacterium]|nr:DUF2344 domain-containing protein [Dehalococcoidia bacterium]